MQQDSTPFLPFASTAVSARKETLAMLRLFARVYDPLKMGLEHSRFECHTITGEAI
jgi:hypothetical protein